MIRNVKISALSLAGILSIGALAAAGAQAEPLYHTSASPTTLSGSSVTPTIFHVPGAGSVECTGTSVSGTITETTVEEFSVKPSFTGCKAFGFAATDIITTECQFKKTKPTLTFIGVHARGRLECAGGNKVKVTPTFFGSSVCTVEVGTQTPGGVIDMENKESETHVLATFTLTEIEHTAGCGASAAADGQLTGSLTEKGTNAFWVT